MFQDANFLINLKNLIY